MRIAVGVLHELGYRVSLDIFHCQVLGIGFLISASRPECLPVSSGTILRNKIDLRWGYEQLIPLSLSYIQNSGKGP